MRQKSKEINMNSFKHWFVFPQGQKSESVDAFLSRLPQSVIKAGKIVDVRSGIAETIKVSRRNTNIILYDTILEK